MCDFSSAELGQMYWAEEEEMKLGIHPTQVSERIQDWFMTNLGETQKITFLDWTPNGSCVNVHINGTYFGLFDYIENKFLCADTSALRFKTKLAMMDSNSIYGLADDQESMTAAQVIAENKYLALRKAIKVLEDSYDNE